MDDTLCQICILRAQRQRGVLSDYLRIANCVYHLVINGLSGARSAAQIVSLGAHACRTARRWLRGTKWS